MTVVLAAGDHFVRTDLLVRALHAEVPTGLEVRELTLPWPDEPFRAIGGVEEASGDEDTVARALDGAEVCVTQLAPLTARVLERAAALRLFAVSRGGPVNADLAAATEHGVAVCFAPGRNAAATAEYTVGMVLAALRRIAESDRTLRGGTWDASGFRYDRCGHELGSATVGLVGSGAVGGRVARILAGFGARVLVFDPYLAPGALHGVAELVGLDELLERAGILSLHARVTAETRGMIGREQIARLPRGAVLVNCARGALLDHEALCDALDDGHLSAAALDVYDIEPPPPDSRLRRTPNLVMTPHLAGASREVAHNAARIVAAEVGRHIRGEPLANLANPAVLTRQARR